MSNRVFIIYALIDPVSKQPKYVGKTEGRLYRRLANHIYRAKSGRSNSPASDWIRSLIKAGMFPTINVLEKAKMDKVNWKQCESKWIRKLKKGGHILLNVTCGGNGSSSRHILSSDTLSLLGKISDTKLAEREGVSRKCIAYHRNKMGIKAIPRKKYKFSSHNKNKAAYNRHKFSKKVLDLIGTMPDTKVAKIAGVHVKTILRFRKRNGIQKYILFGEQHPAAKLNKNQVIEIRSLYKSGSSIKNLANIFGVKYSTIYDIIKLRSWNGC